MITIAIANQKGGVGKTTTSVTLAHGFARQGMRTLLVDLDSQGNVADSLGMASGRELARLLNPMLAEELGSCVVASGRENLDVVRSDKTTAALKTALAGVDFREFALQTALADGRSNAAPLRYEICILDCAPSVDVLQTAALVAADWLVIPTRLDQLAMKGVRDLLVSLAEVHRMKRSVCQVAGILPTFYDRVTGESQKQFEHLVGQFRRLVLPPIPQDTMCREANRAGQTLFEYAPVCRALNGVEALTPVPSPRAGEGRNLTPGAAPRAGEGRNLTPSAAPRMGRGRMGGYLAAQERLMEVMCG